ncbi:F0F1 ATP synthase subunit A [Bernardetia sp.]|uniref:F0F1 ATP synthase subunit A n=1 Tax=Bernardetia sp. TaxID=1937974 RepID=UPI0025C27133|nr:F0F1 ATP synthase subunit A [Bernardetia sp.]
MKNIILPSVQFSKIAFLSILLSVFTFSAFAQEKTNTEIEHVKEDGEFKITEMINHHILDAHEWHFYTNIGEDGAEHHVSLPLPIIVYTNGQLDVFLSSEFHHAPVKKIVSANDKTAHDTELPVVTKGSNNYILEHEHVKVVDAQGNILEDVHPLDLSITKNVASMMIAALLLLIIGFTIAGSYKKREGQAPKGIQSFFEPIIVYLRDDLAIPNIGEHKYKKYFPYLLTLFFFIWFNNLLGLLPTGANTSGNIAFTMTLAALTLLITNISGNKHYWKHIFAMPGVPIPLLLIMIPVELIGIFTKPIALMIRLFANITAGHTIILALIGIIFIFKNYILGVPIVPFVFLMMCLELFVALLQAYIFTLLTALFIGQAVADDHH